MWAIAANSGGNNRTVYIDHVRITVTYTIVGVINWYTVASGGSSVGTGNSFNPVPSVIPDIPNTYPFYAECSSMPGCRSTVTNFIINPLPAQPGAFTQSTSTVCPNTNGLIYTVPNDPSSTYTWTYTGTGVNGLSATTNSVSLDFSSSATSGTLSVTATANNGCGTSAARTLAITVGASAQPGAFTASQATVCQNVSGVVYTVPNDPSSTYTWTYTGTGVNGFKCNH